MDSTGTSVDVRDSLQAKLGYAFVDGSLLALALTHRSWAEEHAGGNNERLEYLGDAVVELVVTEYLVEHFPAASEGPMSRARSRLVRTDTLAKLGRAWGLGEHLLLGRGESASGGADKDSLLANAVEAVLGAIYQDSDLAACRAVLVPSLARELEGVVDLTRFGIDPKSALQELAAAHFHRKPKYEVIGQEGPPHAMRFNMRVRLGDEVLGTGWGRTKREAQFQAAREALEQLRDKIGSKE